MSFIRFYLSSINMERLQNQDTESLFFHLHKTFSKRGHMLDLREITPEDYYRAGFNEDIAIVDKMLTPSKNALSIRRVGLGAFHTIESAEFRRYFRLFDKKPPTHFYLEEGHRNLLKRLRLRYFPLNHTTQSEKNGILAPLQGRLLDKRLEQRCSPLEMLHALRLSFPDKPIYATRHPYYPYSKEELAQFHKTLEQDNIKEFSRPLGEILPHVEFIATMNSTTALRAMLIHRPVMLFADADFHHVCTEVRSNLDLHDAYDRLQALHFNYDAYLIWYLRQNMVSALENDPGGKALEIIHELGNAL